MSMTSAKSPFPIPGQQSGRRLTQAVDRACETFAAKNLRFTKLRQQVFTEIAATHGAIGAYDILDRLAAKGTRLAPISVYRAIDALIAAGVVHRLESKNAFFACRRLHGETRRPLILSCERCGTVGEIEGEVVFETINKVARASGFKPRVKFVEVSGICPNCADKE